MTAREEGRLRALLASLHDYGLVLRASVGAPTVEAALAASGPAVPGIEPAHAAVMPVWAFEPEAGSEDVLLSSVRLPGRGGSYVLFAAAAPA